jgi:bifunctional non-homologous end joining protein LigD
MMTRKKRTRRRFHLAVSPNQTDRLPSGSEWLHEIKHDGFRVIARKKGAQMKLYSRPGNDLTYRSPLIVETLARLRSRSCIIAIKRPFGRERRPSFAARLRHSARRVKQRFFTDDGCGWQITARQSTVKQASFDAMASAPPD